MTNKKTRGIGSIDGGTLVQTVATHRCSAHARDAASADIGYPQMSKKQKELFELQLQMKRLKGRHEAY
ncbi:hypothetical protein E2562_039024 [Oryza meyeriana var. granulata]|uniref:Uncharacterized protein n=1 Tax=Oryza meyeriana var. granulata TaxID=110450 RepID=A0A6G1CKV6_9ORYZ|nr:hypothetical protein E2562_039024 [Oryza meyeriana var. granulata]